MNGYYFNLKAIECGNRIELYKYSIAQEKGFEGYNKTGRKGKGMARVEKNRKETLNRARNNIIRLVNCNPDLTTFISLTYKENMQNLRLSKTHLNILFKQLQQDFDNFKYLYVLEFQQRGAIHYHMLCNFQVHVETAKSRDFKPELQKQLELQFHEMYWPHGWVDIRDLKQEGNTNVGLYVSVYLVEDLYKLDLEGSRCYGYSRNLDRPVEKVYMTDLKPVEVINNYTDYNLKYASNYNMQFEKEGRIFRGNVNYFDMYKKDEFT